MATSRHRRRPLRAAPARPRPGARGFTLLEVMIALAILGLSLSAILSAQAGMYSSNLQARQVTYATAAGRCKMGELEEYLLKNGYSETDSNDEGACCVDESPAGMTCRWAVERVTLPDPPQSAGDLDGGVGGIGGLSSLGGGDAGAAGGLGALGALAGAATDPSGVIQDGGISGLTSLLAGSGNGGVGGGGGIAGMALGMVYPQLKPLLEASIRRVTVEVVWHEGAQERTLKLVQFVTNPNRGLPAIDPSLLGDAGAIAEVGPVGTTTTGTVSTPGLPNAGLGR
jgi:general secretion pathway protein I